MAADPTTGDLFKCGLVTDADVNAAIDAYMADASTGVFPLGDGYTLDLAAAVNGHSFAKNLLARKGASAISRRGVVQTAILLARPEKR